MECNRDEATRAKTIAEKKFADKDYTGAKKFTLKAQTLNPLLDGISHMLITLDVYISSENKINGESDWYKVLDVKPSDDDETIKKQYRKLVLILHPDKNKSVGADGAFKIASEAWSLLSDKTKRLAYNQRRNSSQSSGVNGVHIHVNRTTTRRTTRLKNQNYRGFVSTSKLDSFWTICHGCKMHYEYLKLYLNHTLLCPNCHEPFLAKEMPPPVNLPKPSSSSAHHHQNPTNHVKTTKVQGGPFTKPNVPADPSVATKAASVIQQVVADRLKREREEFYANWPSKKRKADDDSQGSGVKIPFQMSTTGVKMTGFETANLNTRLNRTRELTPLESRNMLMKKAQTEIKKKLIQWESEEKSKENLNKNNNNNNPSSQNQNQNSKQVSEQENGEEEEEEEEELAMNVPDPDFHDFDLERTENSFEDNQVWAAYDDDDGMPRFYALVHKVLSRKPLKMKISWLNSKTTAEFGTLDWLGSGFRKVCGEFRIGRHELYKTLNSFSQKVDWTKSQRGSVLILPRKNQVWALYRNWSPDWDENVPDDVIHKYDMVEVLEDYNEEKGVPVSRLLKHAGFRTVFHPVTDESEVTVIPKEEMFRFSHQVPKYVLNGTEGQNCPKGCLELDPAATPSDLIQDTIEKDGVKGKIGNGEEKKI